MKILKKTLSLSIVTLLLVSLISLYRSYVEQTSFLKAFDNILINTTDGIWVLLQSPIIQTGLLLLLGVLSVRDHLPKLLSVITEIRAGEFSAKINAKELLINEIKTDYKKDIPDEYSKDQSEDNNELSDGNSTKDSGFDMFDDSPKHDITFVDNLFENLPDEICWYFIKVHAKKITFDEHLNILRNEGVLKWESTPNDFTILGYASALWAIFDGVLFILLRDNENKEIVRLVLKPRTLLLIKARLNID